MRRVVNYFYAHPNLTLLLLLLLPMAWLVIFYLGSLATLLVQSFYTIDDFTWQVIPEFSTYSYQELLSPANFDIITRTVLMAVSVTIASAIVAFPLAYYMARFASPRMNGILYLGVMLPLWSSYLVRVYAWKLILATEGIVTWAANTLGLGGVLDWILGLPVIGGASLSGGAGTLVGTMIGSLIIAVLNNGLVILGINPFWQFIAVGVVIIIAVLIDQARDKLVRS